MKKYILLSLLSVLPFVINAAELEQIDKKLIENYDFLEISKNYLKTHDIHLRANQSSKTLLQLNNINFALKPRVSPLKPFDALEVHYAYPLKIFLPANTTVTSAKLSNSKKQPEKSQNIVTVSIDNDFQSGLLDIVYIDGTNSKNGKFLSIKLDKYVYRDLENLENNKLYTQVQYFVPEKINNSKILASLKSNEYELEYNQKEYMGITYDIYLINIIDNEGNYIKEFKDKKYINAALLYNGKTYNYYVK